MKQSFVLLFSGMFLSAAAMAQGSDIPDNVLNHFRTNYPTAKDVDYDKEIDGYEVEFRLNDVKWEAYYDTRGKWIKTERDVKRTDVPDVVWTALSKTAYATWKVDDIEEHQTPVHKTVYEIEVKGKGRKAYLYFLPDGRRMESTAVLPAK